MLTLTCFPIQSPIEYLQRILFYYIACLFMSFTDCFPVSALKMLSFFSFFIPLPLPLCLNYSPFPLSHPRLYFTTDAAYVSFPLSVSLLFFLLSTSPIIPSSFPSLILSFTFFSHYPTPLPFLSSLLFPLFPF